MSGEEKMHGVESAITDDMNEKLKEFVETGDRGLQTRVMRRPS